MDTQRFEQNTDLPFDIEILELDEKNLNSKKILEINSVESVANKFIGNLSLSSSGNESDQISLSLTSLNPNISINYLDFLISEFNNDGIRDRQLEYQRTMEFVDSRSKILEKEVEKIELQKQKFKQNNRLSDIKADAEFNAQQQYNYDGELFRSCNLKKDLLLILLEQTISESQFKLMPIRYRNRK